jgi:hypothetical protein
MITTPTHVDPHRQLRALYLSLLTHQERFDEFKHILAEYELHPGSSMGQSSAEPGSTPSPEALDEEPVTAAVVREHLNETIRDWIGERFEGLSVTQVVQWRAIVVEERLNISLSPWKESNWY